MNPRALPREWVVSDGIEPCPYLPGQLARTPLRLRAAPISPADFDRLLAEGDRRIGPGLYRTQCPACHACEPLRVPAAELRPSASQRRVWRRNRDISIEAGPVQVDDARLDLFNRHKRSRGLLREDGPLTSEGYATWFSMSCTTTFEMRYLIGTRLLGVGIVDLGARDASSVYFYFDPDESRRSLGTFSALSEMAWLRSRGGRYHYLGLHVAACRHLSYKSRFHPHERLVGGAWTRFES